MISDNKKPAMDDFKEAQTIGLAEKVEIISTDDIKIKSIGQLLSSETGRNIMKLLFDNVLSANQISQKTGMSLPLVIYHLKKMQEMGIVKITNVGKNIKTQDMKFYTSSKFAIVILPSGVTERAKTSKSLANSFKTIYRFAAIAVAAVATWFVSRINQNVQLSPTTNAPNVSNGSFGGIRSPPVEGTISNNGPALQTSQSTGGTVPMPYGADHNATQVLTPAVQAHSSAIPVDILWSVVFTLAVVIAGLVIERVLRAYRR